MSSEPSLQFDSIGRTFPGVVALDNVSFGVRAGSVHALMGENGAGKSTLLKILAGAQPPTSGRMLIGEGNAAEPHVFRDTAHALKAGIAVIYQELHLVPELSVAENILLGHAPTAGGVFISRSAMRAKAAQLLKELGETTIDPSAKISSLPIAQRQMVEIAKALSWDAKIIAFDEPTSSLSARETDRLMEVIARLRNAGKVILYVTHRMEEVYRICDAVTILRDGRHVLTAPELASVTRDELVRAMVGRDVKDVFAYSPRALGAVRLEAEGVVAKGLKAPASISVRAAEIVGLFGLIGAGRTEFLKAICGVAKRVDGSVKIDGTELQKDSPAAAIRAGIVYCPEDRKAEGIVPIASVKENMATGTRWRTALGKIFVAFKRETQTCAEFTKTLGIKTPGPWQEIRLLSGGNQQKVILARWMSGPVKVYLLDEPTRGIDVGARAEIYRLIQKLAEEGAAVVVISSDLPEVMGLSDRLIVMREGVQSAEFTRTEATPETVMAAALPLA
jgi:L-arabinose transport system ATP-binding protein